MVESDAESNVESEVKSDVESKAESKVEASYSRKSPGWLRFRCFLEEMDCASLIVFLTILCSLNAVVVFVAVLVVVVVVVVVVIVIVVVRAQPH